MIRPDIVLELAWRYNYMDFAMPYMIQNFKDLSFRVMGVEKKHDERDKKEEKEKDEKETIYGGVPLVGLNNLSQLTAPQYSTTNPYANTQPTMNMSMNMGSNIFENPNSSFSNPNFNQSNMK